MASQLKFLLPLSILAISFLHSSNAESCSSYTFSDNKAYSSCTDLPHLGAALHYNQATSSNAIDIAFRAPQSHSGWVAWGLNPKGPSMVGSQVLVAFFHSNGSLVAYPTQLDSYSPSMAPGDLTFPVSHVSAEYINKEMIIYATLSLPKAKTKFNHVWQAGSTVASDVPGVHPTSGENVLSKGTVEFQ
ncbi:auxin-induced in root cultures protein 12-like protein [Carex littledalei]|uniref:Auxin-induced in root cultures protein 12-like protein n=1 Tax=Carex littledalei TaxID=544730 RepID=A0A833RDG1_9POAL|nr:auxin-induced in root cultures protein 12-like protein [Carex littledalei]